MKGVCYQFWTHLVVTGHIVTTQLTPLWLEGSSHFVLTVVLSEEILSNLVDHAKQWIYLNEMTGV
jgi:hypothetical protein